jgi:phospholipid/cholesterol/gamma-HCH transport system substrate-binding protein
MNKRNMTTAIAATKLAIFTIVSVLVTGLLAVIMGHFGFGSQTEYRAVFSNASELKKGDDVRVAGVSVGSVKGVELYRRAQAIVTFKVQSDIPMTTASGAEVRFLNLVGDRYLALTEGAAGAPRLPANALIPESRTKPALNLTELFNGFQPLFQALTPADVNDLSLNLVRTLQGEGGTVQSLLARTASLTNTLADRDQLVGQVVSNLSTTLQTVDDRHQQLTELVVQLRDWMGNLAHDRKTIGASLQNVSDLTAQVASLVTDARPYAEKDINELRRVMVILNKPANRKVVGETLDRLPTMLRRQARIGTYGSWYNYYLCDFDAKIILPSLGPAVDKLPVVKQLQDALNNLAVHSTVKRCD